MKSLIILLFCSNAWAGLVTGATSGVSADVGSTSKGVYNEIVDSSGKLAGASKVIFTLRSTNFTAATTEAMITLTPARDNVESSTGTTFTVTSGKRLVILGISVCTRNAGAAGQGVVVRIRVNPGGAAIVTSPVVAMVGAGTNLAIANVVGCGSTPVSAGFPTHIEVSGNSQIGISQIGTATAGNDVSLWGYEY